MLTDDVAVLHARPALEERLSGPWVWIDIENTPHAHFLRPFVERLKGDIRIEITARPQAQTLALARHLGMDVLPVGAGNRIGKLGKVAAVLDRAARLAWWVARRGRPAALICCSRSACIAARILGIPSFAILDYEHAELRALSLATTLWMPDVLQDAPLPKYAKRVARFFEGLKENLYLDGSDLDRAVERSALGISDDTFLVISRPPADTAHYAHHMSWRLWRLVTERLGNIPRTRVIVMPRTPTQFERIRLEMDGIDGVEVLSRVIDGPRAIAAADLVVGGGGTVNREAAVLGTPVWSVFSGARPHVDVVLAREGRLRWIEDEATAISLEPPPAGQRSVRGPFPRGIDSILADIRTHITASAS